MLQFEPSPSRNPEYYQQRQCIHNFIFYTNFGQKKSGILRSTTHTVQKQLNTAPFIYICTTVAKYINQAFIIFMTLFSFLLFCCSCLLIVRYLYACSRHICRALIDHSLNASGSAIRRASATIRQECKYPKFCVTASVVSRFRTVCHHPCT